MQLDKGKQRKAAALLTHAMHITFSTASEYININVYVMHTTTI